MLAETLRGMRHPHGVQGQNTQEWWGAVWAWEPASGTLRAWGRDTAGLGPRLFRAGCLQVLGALPSPEGLPHPQTLLACDLVLCEPQRFQRAFAPEREAGCVAPGAVNPGWVWCRSNAGRGWRASWKRR